MKKLISAIMIITIILTTSVVVSAAPQLPTKEFKGEIYYCVNTKVQYTQLVNYAINNLLEEVLIYREPDKTEYDSSWSNDVRNFCDYKNYRELKFLDYNTNTVSGYCDPKPIYDDLNCYVGHTTEAYGKLQIEYNDNKEEIKKAEALINKVLAQVSGKSQKEKVEHIVNYVCSVNKAGSTQMPGGGYDLINGVYDVLTGNHTNVVCTSYAVTLQKFFECAGIEAVMIHNVAHIWNMVCLDGIWYGIDATAGDKGSTMSSEYMLMGYDRLKGFDNGDKTPVATFKSRHKLSEKSYYNTSTTTTSTPSNSASAPSNKPSKNNTSTNSSKTASTTSAANGQTASDIISSQTDIKETSSTPEVKKITIDLTENLVVSADVFKNAKENQEEISLVGKGYSWKFFSGKIQDDSSAESFNAEVYLGEAVPQEAITAIQQATDTETNQIYPFSFSHHGKLPGVADVTIKVAPEFKGKTVYIYYLNDENKPIQSGKGIVAEDNTLTFTTDHCSVWFLSQEKINTGNTLTVVLIVACAVVLLAAGVTAFLLLKRKKQQI